ncbi:MAG TPA: 2-C-methyl-D-erythritol 2,4-cyclodiphosphate synthase [Bacteroidales bacterium]|nr:2-C-methyl-D-erythritol 2,4-cyclodiphosphate synthase [Bacteroidales bacterium]
MNIRIGYGFDVHRLKEGEELVIGGITIPHYKGTEGHSDADVLIHAICDALLGALALGDIGLHFPDTSGEFKGIDSKILLARVVSLLHEKQWRIGNIDSTISLQKPKISTFIPEMCKVLSSVLKTEVENVSIKATTTEKLGFEGREEGVSASAIVLIHKI